MAKPGTNLDPPKRTAYVQYSTILNHTQPHVTILNHTQYSIFGLSMISLSMKNGRDAEVVGGIQQLMLSQRNVQILVVLG